MGCDGMGMMDAVRCPVMLYNTGCSLLNCEANMIAWANLSLLYGLISIYFCQFNNDNGCNKFCLAVSFICSVTTVSWAWSIWLVPVCCVEYQMQIDHQTCNCAKFSCLINQYNQVCSCCIETIYERDCDIEIITTIVIIELAKIYWYQTTNKLNLLKQSCWSYTVVVHSLLSTCHFIMFV